MVGIVDCLIMYCLFQYASIHIRMAQAILTFYLLIPQLFVYCQRCSVYASIVTCTFILFLFIS